MLTQDQNLLDRILTPENLNKAWTRVRKNKGAAGIDGQTINDFTQHFRAHGKGIIDEIRAGRYQPYPVKRVYIEKADGTWRGLGIPTVFDRVIQQAIVQVLSPIVDPTFSDHSYGFRPKRSQHQAVKQVHEYVKQGRKIAVDVDLSKFFDRVNHDFLLTLLGKITSDKMLLKLIARFLRAGMVDEGVWHETPEGVPLGFGSCVALPPASMQSKVALSRHYYRILCWICWIKNWKNAATPLHATPTILLF
jgi:RNA-directed DNA polymerase